MKSYKTKSGVVTHAVRFQGPDSKAELEAFCRVFDDVWFAIRGNGLVVRWDSPGCQHITEGVLGDWLVYDWPGAPAIYSNEAFNQIFEEYDE